MSARVTHWFTLVAVAVILAACHKAPKGVINESDMARLLADLNRAEAVLDINRELYPDDSTKMMLKQAVYDKHGVTQEMFDHSLGWYAQNMDVYADVCDRSIRILEDELQHLSKNQHKDARTAHNVGMTRPTTHDASSDAVDVWKGHRTIVLTSGMKEGYFTWDIEPERRRQKGDKYCLALIIKGNTANMTATLAADYNNGSTTTITRKLSIGQLNELNLQTDSTQQPRRVYGYIHYRMKPNTFAIIDSISLTRTDLKPMAYQSINRQTTIERRKSNSGNTAVGDIQRQRDEQDNQDRSTIDSPRRKRLERLSPATKR